MQPPQCNAHLFYPIKNAEKCVRGETSLNNVGIRAINAKTLLVELENPTPYFTSLTAFPCFLAAPTGSVFSGPFQIVSQDHSWEILLVKNESYWNKEAISLDEVHISIIPDEGTALQLFERGELDWLGGSLSPLPPDSMEKLKNELSFIPNAASTFCSFNTQRFPFDNLNLRRAFSLAINRSEIASLTQTAEPASSFLPPPFGTFSAELTDPSLARQYLQLALQELQTSRLDLTLHYRTGQLEKRIAQTLQRQWKSVLGIHVRLEQSDPKTHMANLQSRQYELSLTSWIAQFDDPVSILDRFKDPNNLKNYPGWESSRYTQLLNEAAHSKKRNELLAEAERLFASEVPLAPIYHWRSPVLVGDRIESIGTTPCGGILFERFHLKY